MSKTMNEAITRAKPHTGAARRRWRPDLLRWRGLSAFRVGALRVNELRVDAFLDNELDVDALRDNSLRVSEPRADALCIDALCIDEFRVNPPGVDALPAYDVLNPVSSPEFIISRSKITNNNRIITRIP